MVNREKADLENNQGLESYCDKVGMTVIRWLRRNSKLSIICMLEDLGWKYKFEHCLQDVSK